MEWRDPPTPLWNGGSRHSMRDGFRLRAAPLIKIRLAALAFGLSSRMEWRDPPFSFSIFSGFRV